MTVVLVTYIDRHYAAASHAIFLSLCPFHEMLCEIMTVCSINAANCVKLQCSVHAHGGQYLVVLHPHYGLIIHSQPGCLPHHRDHSNSIQEREGALQPARHQVWC